MRIGLVSSAVPLVQGGARFIVDWLREELEARNHDVETIYLPSEDDPDTLLQQMAAFRLIKLDSHFERVITFRPPAHVVRHPRKVAWFIHHVRVFYDLWDSPYRDLWDSPYRPVPDRMPGRALRAAVRRRECRSARASCVTSMVKRSRASRSRSRCAKWRRGDR